MKRAFDLVVAIVLVVPALAVCLVLCALIFAIDRHAPLFLQTRLGRNTRTFTLLKLRTMAPDTPDLPTHLAGAARVSRVGQFIRKTKLDELPQIINVLAGDMSFVGPRPCLPKQTELIAARDAHGVFEMRPGVTGLAQVKGVDMSTPVLLAQWDALYFARSSIPLDVQIMLATVLSPLRATLPSVSISEGQKTTSD
ncbi:MAG: sugar transferase [Pseudomonadota bacterium]